jgi:3-deoxy-D-manno-octulosonate 8-phosphate phosphatase (KDO 8-P phosphatase)
MSELKSIKLIVFDVDGVLTDGLIYVNDLGVESKGFHVRDGFAIKAAMSLGL